MESFFHYLQKVDEGILSFLGLDGLPKDMTGEERADYRNYRQAQISHKEALRMALRFRGQQQRNSPDFQQSTYEKGGYDRGSYFK